MRWTPLYVRHFGILDSWFVFKFFFWVYVDDPPINTAFQKREKEKREKNKDELEFFFGFFCLVFFFWCRLVRAGVVFLLSNSFGAVSTNLYLNFKSRKRRIEEIKVCLSFSAFRTTGYYFFVSFACKQPKNIQIFNMVNFALAFKYFTFIQKKKFKIGEFGYKKNLTLHAFSRIN